MSGYVKCFDETTYIYIYICSFIRTILYIVLYIYIYLIYMCLNVFYIYVSISIYMSFLIEDKNLLKACNNYGVKLAL